jgi:hypothetical protein
MSLSDDLLKAAADAAQLETDLANVQNANTALTSINASLLADNATLVTENAELQQKLDDCEATEPEPMPVGGTAWGMGSFRILAGNTTTELDPYRNLTPRQFYDKLNTEFAALVSGAKMNVVRVYEAGMATSYASTDASWVPAGSMPVLSVKGDDAQMANGSMDASLKALVASWPAAFKGYLLWNHERDNDSDALANPQAVMGVHRKALAQFAKVVLANRGTKGITPGCCPTGWNLQDQNTSYPRDVLNPAAELTAAGVPLNQFIFMVDTYYRKAPTAAAVTTVHLPIVKRVKGWGFTRVGFGEVGVDTFPSANRTPGGAYIDAWAAMCKAENIEVVCWYESGGGDKAPTQGWFIFGSPAKTAWAKACA